ncbi:hypothetical protein BCCH1_72810 [Burkholderia contaminans]|uniref:DUF2964 domain-containing protein n=4 Tax=Burkholderia cepacia complex TaxID=87882 RepID=A0A250LJS4_9BURK|nr:hypothetical protein BCCH1_72810 [Burkholderia contaminans]GLZ71985.1 hypothetical protein Bcon01_50300 [Burkholderia contaminans]
MIQINRAAKRHAIMTPDTAKPAPTRAFRIRTTATPQETVMNRRQYRIALATLSVFIALASLAGIIHGMLFDERVFRYSIVTLILSILSFVVLLNLAPGDRP